MKKMSVLKYVMITTAMVLAIGTTSLAAEKPVYNGVDYSPVFDSTEYAALNPDVASTIGLNEKDLFNHFINYGMKEGRLGNTKFLWQANVGAYGNDPVSIYTNFSAKQTGTIISATPTPAITTPVTPANVNWADYKLNPQAAAALGTTMQEKIEIMKKVYPEGDAWGGKGIAYELTNKATWVNPVVWQATNEPGEIRSLHVDSSGYDSWGDCMAFAGIMQECVFGPGEYVLHYDTNNIKAGDLVDFKGLEHTAFVLSVNGDKITIAEGNNGGTVKWGRVVKRSEIYSVWTRY